MLQFHLFGVAGIIITTAELNRVCRQRCQRRRDYVPARRRKLFELANIATSKRGGKNAQPISPLALEAVKRIDAGVFGAEPSHETLYLSDWRGRHTRWLSHVLHEMRGLIGVSWLVFRPYEHTDRAIAFVATPLIFVLVQFCVVTFLIEGLPADGAFEGVGWTTCCPKTRASGRSACR